MFSAPEFTDLIFDNNADFDDLAYRLFKYQYENNELYHAYVNELGISVAGVRETKDIPFLPIGFFKTHEVKTGHFAPELVFESSGTTQTVQSRHLVKEASLYERSFRKAFDLFYGDVTDYIVIGLLPSYLERRHSSLVYMVRDLIHQSGAAESGFYLHDHDKLYLQLQELEKKGRKILLIGVTFALLDFAEKYPMHLQNTLVMETGGMKGRHEEWTREEVHELLKERLGIPRVHSEYGMSELLSQAYSRGGGIFYTPPWMKVLLRSETDPLQTFPPPLGQVPLQGIINVIDLANIHSCAFIATDDIGKIYRDGSFEVLGRMDHSDLRGCSLLAT